MRALSYEELRFGGYPALRSVVHYGVRYDLDGRVLGPAAPLPAALGGVRARAAALGAIDPDRFAEASLVTRYPPGAGIGWHRDAPAFDSPVVGISLGASCTFRLRRRLDERRFARFAIELAPGSGYVLAGAARWDWQHDIAPVTAERYSVTFRVVRDKRT